MNPGQRDRFEARLDWLRRLTWAASAIFLLTFFYHQILRGDYYFRLSENNRLEQVILRPARGEIRDRRGRQMATNRIAYEVWLDPARDRSQAGATRRLTQMFPDSRALLLRAQAGTEPQRLSADISFADLAYLEARRRELPGVEIRERRLRYYPYGATGAHLLGYVGEVAAAQLQAPGLSYARPGDLIGQLGVERSYDRNLRGRPGAMTVVVDHLGRRVETLDQLPAIAGSALELNLDLELQDAIEALLGQQPGAVVALDPRNGQVRALASRPGFTPNPLVEGIDPEEWARLGGAGALLFNRAIQSELPPGSVFKLVMAATGLEEGVIHAGSVFYCAGGFAKGNHYFHCTGAHGAVSLRTALTVSCNSYFYQLGDRLGRERIVRGAQRLGLGAPSGIDLPFERAGALPTQRWLERSRHGRWYGGDNLTIAIGQGPVLVTPIQLANLAALLANGGLLYRPQLVRRIGQGPPLAPVIARGRSLLPHHLAAIREGMWGAVNGGGTAWRAALPEGVAGKTGSAQVVRRSAAKDGPARKEHSWFIGFAPYDQPTLAIAVVLENAGEGGKAAAPLAHEVLARYFEIERRHAPPAPAATMVARAPAVQTEGKVGG